MLTSLKQNLMDALKTPILFLIFNRPEQTKQVFDQIAKAKPDKLLIVADGPREHILSDIENCAKTREIVSKIDWDCDVKTNFSDQNLGCKIRVSSGITWAFEHVNEAIILEDDCLPNPTFFFFCQDLLIKYRFDNRIMTISGDNFQFKKKRRNEDSYYFSLHHHIWGWATWKRAWNFYDIKMKHLPELFEMGWLEDLFGNKKSARIWYNILYSSFDGQINTWDHQWVYTCLINGGLAISPNVNLISNIGFISNSTHTGNNDHSILANIPTSNMTFPLQHPEFVIRDARADLNEHKFLVSSVFERIKNKLKKITRIPC